MENPVKASAYYKAHLDPRLRLRRRLRYMVAYVAIEQYAGNMIAHPDVKAPLNRLLFYLAYVPGMIIGRRWRSYKEGDHPVAKKWLRS